MYFKKRPDLQLGGEDIGMGNDRNWCHPPLQQAHQSPGVIVVAVAEADQVDLIWIYMQSIGIMKHNRRGGPSVPEQLHVLRSQIHIQQDGQAVLGLQIIVFKGCGVFNHNGQNEVLEHGLHPHRLFKLAPLKMARLVFYSLLFKVGDIRAKVLS